MTISDKERLLRSNLVEGDYPFTYFGLWSARDLHTASNLLTSLTVRFEVDEENGRDEENLKSWCAWDATSKTPHTVFHLWIHYDDVLKVDKKIVEMFPERLFGA
jgi:hypothetical protein